MGGKVCLAATRKCVADLVVDELTEGAAYRAFRKYGLDPVYVAHRLARCPGRTEAVREALLQVHRARGSSSCERSVREVVALVDSDPARAVSLVTADAGLVVQGLQLDHRSSGAFEPYPAGANVARQLAFRLYARKLHSRVHQDAWAAADAPGQVRDSWQAVLQEAGTLFNEERRPLAAVARVARWPVECAAPRTGV